MRTYRIEYKEHSADTLQAVEIQANNAEEAYYKAYFDVLKGQAYSAWVDSVKYKNGKTRLFNNFEGKPY